MALASGKTDADVLRELGANGNSPVKQVVEKTYNYNDENGLLLFQVVPLQAQDISTAPQGRRGTHGMGHGRRSAGSLQPAEDSGIGGGLHSRGGKR